MENLSKLQQELINGLIKEFSKINTKPNDSKKRFSIDTINECLKEEERFKQTITKHNLKMINLFLNQFESDIEDFKKEFGDVLNIELGYKAPYHSIRNNTLDSMIEMAKNKILGSNEYAETHLFFVSRNNLYQNSDNRYNYFGYTYHRIYVNFKREKVNLILESGKSVYAYKIIGLEYNNKEYLHKNIETFKSFSTLDEFIQSDKETQQRIIALVQ
jgi:hypothetical protein